MSVDGAMIARWAAAWPVALETWSRYTRLRPPQLCATRSQAEAAGLSGSFAMIRLVDQAVVIDLEQAERSQVADLPVEVLAHEIGHHVLCPATLTEHARMLARMRRALPTLEGHAPQVANLWADLMINDRLQRHAGLRMGEVYRRMGGARDHEPAAPVAALWTLYLRIYEVLWSLPRESLGGGRTEDHVEGDAWLGARLVRSYASDWQGGAGRFAALVLPYLLADDAWQARFRPLWDARAAARGGEIDGLAEIDPEEAAGAVHPATDGEGDGDGDEIEDEVRPAAGSPGGAGQFREPFEYAELLRASGLDIDDHQAAIRYYAERARPHLVRFPTRPAPEAHEPMPEGLEPWSLGDPLDELDWFETVMRSPRVVPGLTTVRRVTGASPGRERAPAPLDLDVYVDSSGSMVNPRVRVSYPALAGAIIALSALRASGRVQVTLWSGTRQFTSTPGFVRDPAKILGVLTGYFGGGTAFPIHKLRDTYAARPVGARPVHILVISDDGVDTMFDKDERGRDGRQIARHALARAGGGGTLVLNMARDWERRGAAHARIAAARDQQGWSIDVVPSMEDLVAFARAFSRRRFGGPREREAA